MLDNREFDIYSFISGFLTCMSLILFYFILNSCQSTEHYPRVNNPYIGRMGQQSSVKACNSGGEGCKRDNSNSNISKNNPFLRTN